MARPDYAHKMTDAELAKLEQRIAKLYKEAADELADTVKAYFEASVLRRCGTRWQKDTPTPTKRL